MPEKDTGGDNPNGISSQDGVKALMDISLPEDDPFFESKGATDDDEGELHSDDTEEEELEDEDDADEGTDDDSETDAEDDEEEEVTLHTVRVDGVDMEVDEEELKAGYSRTAHFTQKMQTVSKKEADLQTQQQEVNTNREQYIDRIKQVETYMDSVIGEEPDWAAIQRDHPEQYAEHHAQWKEAERRRDALRAERVSEEEKATKSAEAEHQTFVAHQQALLREKVPELKQPETAKEFKRQIYAYAESVGMTQDEVDSIADHRALLVLRDAAKITDLKARKKTVKRKVRRAKALPPKARKSQTRRSKTARDAQARVRKTGSEADARAALDGLNDLNF